MARKGVGRGQFTFNLQTFLRSLSRYFLLKRKLLGTGMILPRSPCIRDDRYRSAIASRLLSGKKGEIQKNGKRNERYARTYLAKFRDGFSAANTRCWCSPSVSRGTGRRSLVGETRDRTSTALFRPRRFPIRSIKARLSAYFAGVRLEPRPSRSVVHRDIHYQIFEFKMGDVLRCILYVSACPTCRFHNPRDRSIRSGVILLYRGRFDACVRDSFSRGDTIDAARYIEMNVQFHL